MSPPAGGDAATQALAIARRKTVGRAVRAYMRWIVRSVGWASIVYLIVWSGVFLIAGLESVPRPATPLRLPVPLPVAIGALVAVGMATSLAAVRAPPLVLDRRDLIRAALAPIAPRAVLRWPFVRQGTARIVAGAAVGGLWTFLAAAWFGVDAPYAAVAAALLAWSQLQLAWWTYADADRPIGRRGSLLAVAGTLAAAILGGAVPDAGLAAALTGPSPLGLLGPAALAALTAYVVRLHGQERYPPRFAAQSFVLGRLQALRTWEMLSRATGAASGVDPGERRRLLDALHDRPSARRPTRSVPLPRADRAAWVALAWRSWSGLVRRPLAATLALGALLASAVAASAASLGTPLASAAATAWLTVVASRLLDGTSVPRTLPLGPSDRTFGRVVPGLAIATVLGTVALSARAANGTVPSGAEVLSLAAIVVAVFVLLEKVGTWIGSSRSPEASIAVAVTVASPALLAHAFAVPGLASVGVVVVAFLAWWLPA
ncbi:MAG: hypothetical protein WD336_11495 [Trueperaceae bacterium]